MDISQTIDAKLYQFADKYKAEVRKESLLVNGTKPVNIRGRNIFWSDGLLYKGILIQPHLSPLGKITGLWNFEITAWLKNTQSGSTIPFWERQLLTGVEFKEIEMTIDDLLNQSWSSLESITKKDLRKTMGKKS